MLCDAPLILFCDSFSLYIAIADSFGTRGGYSRDHYGPGPGHAPPPAHAPAPAVSIIYLSDFWLSLCLFV